MCRDQNVIRYKCVILLVKNFLMLPEIQDYTLPSNVLTVGFAAGITNGAVMNAPITILNDDTVENTETVVLMGSTSPGVKASFAPGQDRVTVSIYDNDGEGIFLTTCAYI